MLDYLVIINLISKIGPKIAKVGPKIAKVGPKAVKAVPKAVHVAENVAEATFHGVPLSELNKLARECYHGIKVVPSGDTLVFHFTSASRKTRRYTQMIVNEVGKLIIPYHNYYPNEYMNSADTFVEKANELYTFLKK